MIPENPPPHFGTGNVIPFPSPALDCREGAPTETPFRLEGLIPLAERGCDFVTVFCATLLTYFAYHATRAGQSLAYPMDTLLECAAQFGFLFVLLLEKNGDYRPYLSLLAVKETERLLRVTAESFLIAVPIAYFAGNTLSRVLVLLLAATVPLAVSVEKSLLRKAIQARRERGHGSRNAVILGGGQLAKNIYSVLMRSPKIGLYPVAIVDEDAAYQDVEIHASSYHNTQPALVLAGPLSARMFRNLSAKVLVIANPDLAPDEVTEIMALAGRAGISTYFVSRDFLEPGLWLEYREVDGMILASFATGRKKVAYEIGKRALDILTAALLLLFLAPVLALICVLIRLTSPGGAIFRQRRVGWQGRAFDMYKFRTMFVDSPVYALSPTSGRDERITPIGRFLRRSCLDEVPQLWNVLLGDMSLVGPRPEMPFIVERYTPMQYERLAVKPGLTGLWQLSADRSFLIHENIEYDLYYIRNRNLFMDFAVLFHTAIFAARGV